MQAKTISVLSGQALILAPLMFFLFFVGRNSVNFAPPCPRKSLAGWWFVCGSGAKLIEFRPGGGAKLSLGGAKFVDRFAAPHQMSKTPPTYFRTSDAIGHT